ncbi:MAG: Proposed peptidoglycan lipid II flippase MurJ [uncultured Nocardioides sp.]|uniref:Proposed peptidoglycan lipid II flippase MurJ n=1 Tax=uncultured Nocardioides sp. TaxID=198441 RepID=A0A6J4NRF5_9ACTN|nr:MAG: Proposed peptidoglycan lipid II flippase MurJ [uncultured Nocardioides sp.]
MTDQRILTASAVMAAGTVFSRLSGFVRSALLVLALGAFLRADLFAIANTLPNMVYILVAGGIFNAVLVPQLVRRIRDDPDGGDAYASRVITLSALFLAAVTVLLVLVTPQLLQLYLAPEYREPALAPQLETVVDLTRWCLPQVFFYGMFVLVGQILNARERFGPMMWAPIANNVVTIVMLVGYLVVWGASEGAEQRQALSTGQETLLGLGSTLGILVQLAVLVPYLRSAGFSYRPRFDFRDPELRRTLSLGLWTVLYVVVTQLAYLLIVRLASGGAAAEGTGYTVYSACLLIMMVPHAVITVSLATAMLPSLSRSAHEGRLSELGGTLSSTLRTVLALVLPIAVILPVLAPDITAVLYNHGGDGEVKARAFAPALAVFGAALPFFTVHYVMLRGFYALEQTRKVFVIQCGLSLTNVVVATVLVQARPPVETAPMLALGYLVSYAVGAVVSYLVLRRTVGGLDTRGLLRFLARMAVALAAGAAAAVLVVWALAGLGETLPPLVALARGAVAGLTGAAVVVATARLLHVEEVTSLLDTVAGRLQRRRGS